jgi:hypothetical protein
VAGWLAWGGALRWQDLARPAEASALVDPAVLVDARLGRGASRPGRPRRALSRVSPCLEVLPSFGGGGARRALGGVVVVEPALRLTGRRREDVDVSVGHGDVSPGRRVRGATGSASEQSSSAARRNPRTRMALRTA